MLHSYDIVMTTRFRGIDRRQGLLWQGPAGWAEWSPFLDYDGAELVPWLAAANEAAQLGFPEPVRETVPVNCTVPAVPAERAAEIAAASGCDTAKIKVAEPGQTLAEDLERVEAVAAVVDRVRVDANGNWSVEQALRACRELTRFDLEYVEQPCAEVTELAEVRRSLARAGVEVAIAADESIRRSGDPERVVALAAADIAILKVQPLGGVRRCLELAERLRLPVVVSSALETSVGIAAGLALAAALPELPYACGLNTAPLLAGDPADGFVAEKGVMRPRGVWPEPAGLARVAADAETEALLLERLSVTRELARRDGRTGTR